MSSIENSFPSFALVVEILKQAGLPVDYEKAAQRYLKAANAKHAEVKHARKCARARDNRPRDPRDL